MQGLDADVALRRRHTPLCVQLRALGVASAEEGPAVQGEARTCEQQNETCLGPRLLVSGVWGLFEACVAYPWYSSSMH